MDCSETAMQVLEPGEDISRIGGRTVNRKAEVRRAEAADRQELCKMLKARLCPREGYEAGDGLEGLRAELE